MDSLRVPAIEGFSSKRALEILAKNENRQFSSKVPEFQQFALELNQETSPGYLFADFYNDSEEKRKGNRMMGQIGTRSYISLINPPSACMAHG